MMKLSIIVPVYRGGNILKLLLQKINETLSNTDDYEILFVCDHCDDLSLKVIRELKNEFPMIVRTFLFGRNYGQHRALQFGFGQAKGEFIITMDEDLQHDPADILKLAEKQKEGDHDLVYGRFINHHHKGIRNFVSDILRKALKRLIPELDGNYSPYRLIKRETAVKASLIISRYVFIDDLLGQVTSNNAHVDIEHHERQEGHSSYSVWRLAREGILILLAYSGIITWFLALGILIILLVIILQKIIIPGLITGMLVAGLILIIFGFAGNIINRQSLKKNSKPVTLIDESAI